jgi:hypothetical protein
MIILFFCYAFLFIQATGFSFISFTHLYSRDTIGNDVLPFFLDRTMASNKGMSRILSGIIKYRQTLRPALLEEFQRVALGPSVSVSPRKTADHDRSVSLKVCC